MAIGLGRAIGITAADVPAQTFFILVPVCMMVASIPLAPGGWGVREGAFIAFFGPHGVPLTTAVALSILLGLTTLFWSLLGGVFFFTRPDRISKSDMEEFSHEVEDRVESSYEEDEEDEEV